MSLELNIHIKLYSLTVPIHGFKYIFKISKTFYIYMIMLLHTEMPAYVRN